MLSLILTATLLALLFGCAFSDFTSGRIPNFLTFLILIVAILRAVLFPSFGVTVVQALTSAGLVLVLGYAVWRFRFIGAGDIKMLTAVSALANLTTLPIFILLLALIGGAQAIVFSILEKRYGIVLTKNDKRGKTTMPAGISIAISTVIFVLYGVDFA